MTRSAAARPRVALVLLDAGLRHGTAHAAHELLRRLSDEYTFTVVSTRLAEELVPLARFMRIPAPAGPYHLRWLVFHVLAGMAVVRARADVVHTIAPAPLVPNRVDLATVMFSQLAFYEAGGGADGMLGAWSRAVASGIERRAYRPGRVRMLSALAPGGKRELERHHPGVPVTVTPHVLQGERFYPDTRARAEVRGELGAAADAVVTCFVNNTYWEHKGLEVAMGGLARAARIAPALGPLWVVGSGPVERFRAIASALGLERRVRFLGPRSDIARIYRGADILVHPAQYETFSLAVHEAAATGLAVVATRTNGVEDLLEDGEAGIMVERTAEAVGEALIRLARDPGLRTRMGRTARTRALAFGPDRFVSAVRDAYRLLR